MFVPIPPRIPSAGQFNSLQIDQFVKNDGTTTGNNVSDGFVSGQGSFTSVVGQSVTYSANAVCSGVIIRTGTTVAYSNDVLPLPIDMATTLGLSAINGNSYLRNLTIYNNANYDISLSGTNWTILGTNIARSFFVSNFVYSISYSAINGWTASLLSTSTLDLS